MNQRSMNLARELVEKSTDENERERLKKIIRQVEKLAQEGDSLT